MLNRYTVIQKVSSGNCGTFKENPKTECSSESNLIFSDTHHESSLGPAGDSTSGKSPSVIN